MVRAGEVVAIMSEALLEKMSEMSPKQLAEVEARLLFLKGSTPSTAKAQSDENIVSAEFVQALRPVTGGKLIPRRLLLGSEDANKKFEAASEVLIDYIKTNFQPANKVDQLKCLRLLLKLCMKDLSSWKQVQHHPKALVNRMINIGSVVAKHFPGYQEAGLLRIVLQRPMR